ncbi:hypothetical protein, partial [Aquimarina aggregata]|uniref:hypothetical protein n=1 Tax=Aquimarina aggregata TaxID=1642818 RepID=UPI000ACFBBA2
KVMDYLNSPLELKSVSAVDGFYSWKDEYKSEAKSFAFLPEKLKTVTKDIEAYFVYSWHYDKLNKDVDLTKVIYNIHLSSNGEKYVVKNEIVFKLKSELIFRSPIRFH